MATQTGSIDLSAAKKAHDDAEKKATNYVLERSNGILVHPEDDTSNGVLIKDTVEIIREGDSVAEFGEAARIGRDGETRVEIDYHSLQMIDKNGIKYLHVSDLRDKSGLATLSEGFDGDGSTNSYTVAVTISEIVEVIVYVEGSPVDYTDEVVVSGTKTVTLPITPEEDAAVIIRYKTADENAKAFTFGDRGSNPDFNIGSLSFAAGQGVTASGHLSHAEGYYTQARGYISHAEGYSATASGSVSHAEGNVTKAWNFATHAEGLRTEATGYASHAEGDNTKAKGIDSHAEGYLAQAVGKYSHAQNLGTIANRKSQTTIGEYNTVDENGSDKDVRGKYAFIIGNGTNDSNRSNAFTVDWDGNVEAKNIVTDVSYDSADEKLTKTINGTTSDIVTLSVLASALRFLIVGLTGKGAITNFDDTTTSGFYTYASSAINRPPLNAGGTCLVLKNGNFVTQICFPNRSSQTATPTFYIRRTYAADSWQAWYQIVPTATS